MLLPPSHHWHTLTHDKVLTLIESNLFGLTTSEAEFRLEKYGRNDVSISKRESNWSIFISQFKNPLIYILVFASIIAAILGDILNGGIILGAVILNTLIGFFQELKVSNILNELNKVVNYHTRVIRDDTPRVIDAKQVVVGDLLMLRQGDKVPADARLIKLSHLKTNEVALSGESSSVIKDHIKVHDIETSVADRNNMVFMGTSIEEGIGQAVVVATGLQTEFGKIAELVQEHREGTPLQRKLGKMASRLGFLFLSLSSLLFVIGILRGQTVLTMFLTAVAVAVAAVPESLPIALSSTLAVGAQRIFKKGGLIRKIIGAEALGSTTVITADKTATMTEGKMKLTTIVIATGEQFEENQFFDIVEKDQATSEYMTLQLLALTHNAIVQEQVDSDEIIIQGSAIDRALISAIRAIDIDENGIAQSATRIAELPFNSRKKYASFLYKFREENKIIKDGKDKGIITVLGAPEILLTKSTRFYSNEKIQHLQKTKIKELHNKIDELASNGFKVLALVYRKVPSALDELNDDMIENLTFISLVAFSDPIREDVRDSINVAKKAGVRVVMITGDHRYTAKHVAENVGILGQDQDERIIEGKDLPLMLSEVINKYDVFARVSPEDKLNLVQAFKDKGESVAMIGDGINDAPALIRADLGVAVASGTDVAKEVADLILVNDSFSIVVEAIRQGRIILNNIKKTLLFLIGSAFSEVILISGSILLGLPLALLPAQILWVNIIVDGLPAISFAFEGEEGSVMNRKVESMKAFFTKEMKRVVLVYTLITNFALLGLYVYLYNDTADLVYTRTMIFVGLGITSLFFALSLKSLYKPIWKTKLTSNPVMLWGIVFGIFLYIMAIYTSPLQSILETVPLSILDWIILFILTILNLAVIEWAKARYLRPVT